MNIPPPKAEAFLDKPGGHIRCVLFHGPDRGLVQERAERLAKAAGCDLADPFATVELAGSLLRSDPARLVDEVAALTFSGGRRLVRVRDAVDGTAGAFESVLEGTATGALVIVEAGVLNKRAALRKLFEQSPAAAAVACYPDEDQGLVAFISTALKEANLDIDRDAAAFLAARLGSDRALVRRELEKLALYAGSPAGSAGTLTLDDCEACVGDTAESSLDALTYAVFDGDTTQAERAISRAEAAGTSAVAILRTTARHVQRLLLAQAQVSRGTPAQQALERLRPPVFFKFKERFRAQMTRWSDDQLADVLNRLLEAEIACKSTGVPEKAVVGHTLLEIALTASAGRRE